MYVIIGRRNITTRNGEVTKQRGTHSENDEIEETESADEPSPKVKRSKKAKDKDGDEDWAPPSAFKVKIESRKRIRRKKVSSKKSKEVDPCLTYEEVGL